jgi:hypothetical protein
VHWLRDIDVAANVRLPYYEVLAMTMMSDKDKAEVKVILEEIIACLAPTFRNIAESRMWVRFVEAQISTVKSIASAAERADEALEQYRKRFGAKP